MYIILVILLLLVCPAASVLIEGLRSHQALSDPALIARWWAFWAVGVRLFVAGIRQVLQPRFTAEEIFGIRDAKVWPLVREIGFGNLSMGFLGICSVFHREWAVPAAIVGGLYYGFAGAGHIPQKNKNANEYVAMITDAFACVMLIAFAVKSSI